jgi:Fe2+ transport system protein FeoA
MSGFAAPAAHLQCAEAPGCLGCLPPGGAGVVRRVSGERHLVRRLMEMGLLPGTPVSVARVAPLGDPLELRLRGYALSIRRLEAMGIEIEIAPGRP